MPPSSALALDYAPPPTARRRLLRRLRRGLPVALLLVIAGLGVAYGPGVWRRWQVLRLQEACMKADLPADRPVWEQNAVVARSLVAAWPGEYQADPWGAASRADLRWTALQSELGIRAWFSTLPGSLPTLFCHERYTPDGRRRLVVIEGRWAVTVIAPANWPVGDGPRVVWREEV